MSIMRTNSDNYAAIAAAIRAKLGESTTYLPSEMAPAILRIGANEVKLSGIEVTKSPDKTIYSPGDTVDLTGMECRVTYNNGSSRIVTSGFTPNPRTVAEDTSFITISYVEGTNVVYTAFGITIKSKDIPDGDFYQLEEKKISELLSETYASDNDTHPAFSAGGRPFEQVLFSKYLCSLDGGKLVSAYEKDPAANMTVDQYISMCRENGKYCHPTTAAEWGYLLNWCEKERWVPRGNNSYGKDSIESVYEATVSSRGSDGDINRTATGTGGKFWYHDHETTGIADMKGNVWKFVPDVRLVRGQLQVIPYNRAAIVGTDISSSSSEWRAIRATAQAQSELFVAPDDSSAQTVRLDYNYSGYWVYSYRITSSQNAARWADVMNPPYYGLSDFTIKYLQIMGLVPQLTQSNGTYTMLTDSDIQNFKTAIWANNGADEVIMARGGCWETGLRADVFAIDFTKTRSYSGNDYGGFMSVSIPKG